jgi:hypothetical protein
MAPSNIAGQGATTRAASSRAHSAPDVHLCICDFCENSLFGRNFLTHNVSCCLLVFYSRIGGRNGGTILAPKLCIRSFRWPTAGRPARGCSTGTPG